MSTAKKILVIQEDLILRSILERFVLSLGFSCSTIPSLSQFDPEVQGREYDILITDILFEDIGRLDFTLQAREKLSFSNVLVITHMDQEIIKQRVMAIPEVDEFFGMPLDFRAIEKQLKSY